MKALIYKWLCKKADQQAQQRATRWLVELDVSAGDKSTASRFSAWLERDPRNQKAFLYVQALDQAAASQSRPVSDTKSKIPTINTWLLLSVPVAACCLMAVLLFKPWVSSEYYQTGEQRNTILLTDNSSIRLQPNTVLETHYSANKRIAKLIQGEVFFSVAHDIERPFIVETPSGTVTVLGTQFSVSAPVSNRNLGDGSKQVKPSVTVINGRVAVKNFANQKAELSADQTIELNARGQEFLVQEINAREQIAWRKDKFIFRQQPLSQVVKALNDHFGRNIQLDNQALANLPVDAVLRADDFQFALDMITRSMSLSVTLEDNGIIRLSR